MTKGTRIELKYIQLLLLTIAFSFSAMGQTVPSQMKIGNVRLTIEASARKQIQQDVDRLSRSPTYFNILVDRMNLYFPIIEREHRNAKVPEEIKFLAIQESALISDAVSIANAVGYWQFKDFTAREVGMRVDRQVDERLNIVSSSRGSAKYFLFNNRYFDNWAYAVIAYQAGAGGAQKQVDKSKYGATKLTITTKTYWYLKKFIAHIVAFENYVGKPHSEGLWLEEDQKAGGMTIEQIAKKHKVDLEELKSYNKWLKRGPVPVDRTYSVLIPRKGGKPTAAAKPQPKKETPTNKIEQPTIKKYPTTIKPGLKNAESTTVIPLNGLPAILAKPGDNVLKFSARAGLTEDKFRDINDLKKNEKLIANEFYYIKRKKSRSKISYHVLRPNESLWDVSQQYGIQLKKLQKKNRLEADETPKTGRVLWLRKTRPAKTKIEYHKQEAVIISEPNPTIKQNIPRRPEPSDPQATEEENSGAVEAIDKEENAASTEETEKVSPIVVPVTEDLDARRKVKIHTVAKGESLWSISRLYEVQMEDLLRWNELPDPSSIAIGQNIQVKAPIEEASQGKDIKTHTVAGGETVYAISRKYDMTVDEIMDLNNLTTFDLDVGQELKVYEK